MFTGERRRLVSVSGREVSAEEGGELNISLKMFTELLSSAEISNLTPTYILPSE
jgi:hypothetical protein